MRSRLLALSVAAFIVLGGGASAVAASPDLVISQVYGAGGNSGAVRTHDYVELYNRGTAPVSLSGWSIQYASATGTGNFGSTATQLTELPSVTVQPGTYFLVQQAGGTTGAPLPTADHVDPTPIAMAAGSGKVALVTGTTSLGCNGGSTICDAAALGRIVDLVGYGNANFFEGTGAAPELSATTAALRAGNGSVDTDDNAADFAAGTPNPRNSGAGADAAPSVSTTAPTAGAAGVARDANVSITFSEPVTVSGAWFSIACAVSGAHTATVSGGPSTFVLDPVADFDTGESCTVTVEAARVSDNDTGDPPDTMSANFSFSFSTVGIPATIMQIQGAAHVSPLAGRWVSGVAGVVTAIRPQSFYMQHATGDGVDATSDGILVFVGGSTASLTVGSAVLVSGQVTEFRPGGNGGVDNLTTTEITDPVITPAGPATPITPTILGEGGRTQPNVVIEDDAPGDLNSGGPHVFDPTEDGIDFYESLEGMLLRVNDGAVVGATRSFGEVTLLADGGENAVGLRTPRGGILLSPSDANPERIIIDDEILRDRSLAMPLVNVGGTVDSAIGPLDYSFENYKIQVLAPPSVVESPIEREVAAVAHPSDLTVATFNVENLASVNLQAKFDQLAGMIVDNLRSPDIIGIEEVQDDNGGTNNGNVTATATWNRLIDAIESAGGPSYDFRQIDPVNNVDGGAPGANIRVGFLFRADLADLRFVDRPGGTSTNNTSVVGPRNHPRLTFSPGRLGTASAAFIDTRKPLVGEFVWKDRTVFVVVNHFSSKGDDQGLFSRWQPPTNFSEGPRHGQAQVVNDFVDDVLALDKDANVIVLGDINDFEFSETIEILEGDELTTLMKILPANERYSYVFEGNSQVLDQILVSDAILKRSPAYDVVHVNSEFADARQASDHEPQVAYLRPKGTGEEE